MVPSPQQRTHQSPTEPQQHGQHQKDDQQPGPRVPVAKPAQERSGGRRPIDGVGRHCMGIQRDAAVGAKRRRRAHQAPTVGAVLRRHPLPPSRRALVENLNIPEAFPWPRPFRPPPPHRQEPRGIGGIFYDRLTPEKTGVSWEEIFEFSCAVGRSFAPIYAELVNRSRHKAFTEAQKQWQYVRRGRYVEFNLVYDAGTKFGLETNGRIESILMSLPPQAHWPYDYQPEPGSEEAKTLALLKKDIDWVRPR